MLLHSVWFFSGLWKPKSENDWFDISHRNKHVAYWKIYLIQIILVNTAFVPYNIFPHGDIKFLECVSCELGLNLVSLYVVIYLFPSAHLVSLAGFCPCFVSLSLKYLCPNSQNLGFSCLAQLSTNEKRR